MTESASPSASSPGTGRAPGSPNDAAAAGPAPLLIPAAAAAADTRPRLATLIGADFSALSITPQRSDGAPGVVRSALARFSTFDAHAGIDLADWSVTDLGDAGAIRMAWPDAFDAIVALADRAHDNAAQGDGEGAFVAALGGDHSVSWPLVTSFARRHQRVGILQLDVHHDVRSLADGPSNGTPIRGLVERGTIAARDVVQVGIHPFGNRRELSEWCDEHGVTRFSLADVERHGAGETISRALAALRECDAIYLTVDIDVLDRAFAPGTVAALPGGLSPARLAACVSAACADPRVRAMDIVEFDPTRDVAGVTAYNAALTLFVALSAIARRTPS